MHDRVSVHSVCFPTAGVAELELNWRALGARRVSFNSQQLLDAGPRAVRDRLDEAGQCVETVTHVFRSGPLDARGADMAADTARLAQAIEASSIVGARSVYMLTGGRGAMDWEAAAAAFAEAVAPCQAAARAASVVLAVENTSPFFAHGHIATNLRDTITLSEIAGIGVCIDYFACWTEAGMREQIARAMPRLALVQVSDFVLGDRSLPCRAVPGDGAIPWPTVLRWLLDAGYTGTFDLELIGPRIDQEGQMQAVRRAADTVGTMLIGLGA